LKRILCYGNVDFSTAALRLFWKRRIHVVFLSPGGHAVLGKLEPGGSSPNLRRLQHLAAADPAFSLTLARQTVSDKIAAAAATCRYFQQQGKGQDGGRVLAKLKECGTQAEQAKSVATLLGLEGSAAALWYGFLASVLPAGWTLPGRVAHPPTDPVNALLSLGYTFALTRCQTLLAAADLDPLVGFLHEVRPGRPSLACDLVEPLRAPLVDRLVVGMLARRQLTLDSFAQQDKAWRLNPESFKLVLSNFEQAFSQTGSGASWKEQTLVRIDQWSSSIRRHFER
jgi:CRISPR-associated protein Cas1